MCDLKIVTQPYHEFFNPNWEEFCIYFILVYFFGSALRNPAKSYLVSLQNYYFGKGLNPYSLFLVLDET